MTRSIRFFAGPASRISRWRSRRARRSTPLYDKLATVILPLYDADSARWIWMMKQAISKLASYFNSQRMMRRCASEAYFR